LELREDLPDQPARRLVPAELGDHLAHLGAGPGALELAGRLRVRTAARTGEEGAVLHRHRDDDDPRADHDDPAVLDLQRTGLGGHVPAAHRAAVLLQRLQHLPGAAVRHPHPLRDGRGRADRRAGALRDLRPPHPADDDAHPHRDRDLHAHRDVGRLHGPAHLHQLGGQDAPRPRGPVPHLDQPGAADTTVEPHHGRLDLPLTADDRHLLLRPEVHVRDEPVGWQCGGEVMTSAATQGALGLCSGRLTVDGTPSVLLCSSVFPFRIPREQWDHRLQLVQESGYRMVDLYVHWGFHEEEPGRIDLSSPERDLRHFLDLAAARDLLVMARPGPYICSETDGGGLPWWLHGDADGAPAALRTTDPDYLAAVDRWFAAVMPILADAQVTRGGAVALVQIENELDFFDCPDPEQYMDHLAARARQHGIEVPLIACAGQGDLAGASGDVDGVVPTVNLYPDDASTTFDEETRRYADVAAQRDLPLMVTETNRLHRTLRREILAGARLVAPYLQT